MDIVEWTTKEFEEKDRHPDWIWYAGLVAVAVAVLSFVFHNLFFGIFALVAGGTVIFMSFHKPKELIVRIEEKGIRINEEFFPYERIVQYWLDETQKPDKLLILIGGISPLRVLPLENITADMVKNAIGTKAPEIALKESFGSKLFDRLGF